MESFGITRQVPHTEVIHLTCRSTVIQEKIVSFSLAIQANNEANGVNEKSDQSQLYWQQALEKYGSKIILKHV